MVGEMFDKIDMEFVEYVYTFYGSGMVTHYDCLDDEKGYEGDSIYGKEFFPSTGGVTRGEIIMATKLRMSMEGPAPFEGDSWDREIVRDIMIEAKEEIPASPSMASNVLKKNWNTIKTKPKIIRIK